MLSTLLHSHIDSIEEIEKKAQADIDKIIAAIDVKELMKDPRGVMAEVSLKIKQVLEDKHLAEASKLGLHLADKIEGLKKPIKVDPSKDPTKNA